MKFLATLLSAFAVFHVNAQSNRPLGSWDDFLPYKNARMVAQSPDKIFCATAASMYFVQKSDLYMERMSKCNGLSDIGFRAIEYDAPRQQVIVAYENSNIDLWSESGVANIPDIKLKNIVGDKTIYHVYPDGDRAYLSMGFGIVVLDLEKREVKDTYYIGTNGTDLKVNAVTTAFGRVFAATADGLYTADAASPALNNFNVWLRLDTASALPHSAAHQVYHDGTRVFAVYHDSLFAYDGAAWTLIYSHPGFTLNHVKRFNAELYVSEINLSTGAAQITLLDASTNAVVNTMPGGEFIGNPMDVEVDETGRMWLADLFRGLSHSKNNAWSFIYPDGPGSANVWQIDAYRGNAYVAPGGLTTSGGFSFNEDGFFVFENNEWKTYSRYNHPAFSDSIKDIIGVSHNALTGKTYFTSFIEGGILEYENNAFTIYKQGIVSVDPAFYNHPTFDAVTDGNGNTWFSNPTTTKPLIVRTPDGQWKAFGFTGLPGTVGFTRLYADYNNRIWIVLKNEGLVVYDPGADVLSAADDDFRRLTATDGQGSLPSNTVLDVAMDLNGEVWIGTDKGIAVM
ncbi:MAG TPA: hypothetical protein VEY71_03060, partial [Chitinophagales bacterium]|nr:hypothetical protein [Chitinophagales bacterium]